MTSTASKTGVANDVPSPQVRFVHASGHANVRRDVDALLRAGTKCIRVAVCYFTEPGYLFLARHATALTRQGSFFVTSIDRPTNLEALARLHEMAPGHVYIHLGGSTPEEEKVGRALMHSKVLLALGEAEARLWVGSHNLTGQAIYGGNFEAAIQVTVGEDAPSIQDAISHLEACRTTAELFDPSQMARYRAIQKERLPNPPEITARKLLVIHAETASFPGSTSFTVHLRVAPTDYDSYFAMDRQVRLYLHPIGGLKRGLPADFSQTALWTGAITAVVRTEMHPQNTGLGGQFDNADFDLDIPDLTSTPTLVPGGHTHTTPSSQVVLRMDQRGRPGDEIYSVEPAPVENVFEDDAYGQELHEVDDEAMMFFTPESIAGGSLIYRAVQRMRQIIRIVGYEETMRTDLPNDSEAADYPSRLPSLSYEAREAKHPVDAFFFVTKHVVDRTRRQ